MDIHDNLPPGADEDQNAPFNNDEIICPKCEGEGTETNGSECYTCEGTGEVSEYEHKQLMKIPENDR